MYHELRKRGTRVIAKDVSRFGEERTRAGSRKTTMPDELKVMSARAVKSAVIAVAQWFSEHGGCEVAFDFAPVGALEKKIADGERADVVILSDVAIGEYSIHGPHHLRDALRARPHQYRRVRSRRRSSDRISRRRKHFARCCCRRRKFQCRMSLSAAPLRFICRSCSRAWELRRRLSRNSCAARVAATLPSESHEARPRSASPSSAKFSRYAE